MICYLDRTFCSSIDCKNECGRQLTKELREGADRWAKECGFEYPPISFSDFCSKKNISKGDNNDRSN